MLPNRMVLSRQTEDQLKKLKGYTGITPNVAARLAFFRSVESEFRYSPERDIKKLDGSLVLDKITWLGETLPATELVLKMLYPQLEQKILIKAWAAHVEDGIAALRNYRNLKDFTLNL
ncbi:DNA sulfur modification protein DndE [Salmonella enterica subsp. enterica serovar Legon]|uniref:DNA sulfur modification protein DndE n=1 Tax=Salmonella enterica TaxID=28901 RepID=UPI000D3E6067|nr:DNA sulfur modification protein DndE [Salmonella enterica]EDS6803140.1 DNA sulfur modification protein DndE [Salmonella enterica subsp. enterica serovar Legon]PVB76013.1 DNA sulfur modification protein DndE [Salmonella enterica subsp. enterica serovar Legon]PVB88631.1 DNA sulfur modification protein DndE [Salmonella enterica subsp. enterica serovar Legon]PVB92361.1 DNA sulfur modification protein DndE [Salmonella enterica subsp. enterica serovar Legon]PVB98610.1 DNA sulfur modification prot